MKTWLNVRGNATTNAIARSASALALKKLKFKKSPEKLNLSLTILTEFLGLKKRFEMCQFLIKMRNQRRRWHTVTVFENHTKKSHFTVSQFFTENYKLGLRYFFDFRSENSKAKKIEMRHFCWFLNTVKLWNCLD